MNAIEQNKAAVVRTCMAAEQIGFTAKSEVFADEDTMRCGLFVEHWTTSDEVGMVRLLGLLTPSATHISR